MWLLTHTHTQCNQSTCRNTWNAKNQSECNLLLSYHKFSQNQLLQPNFLLECVPQHESNTRKDKYFSAYFHFIFLSFYRRIRNNIFSDCRITWNSWANIHRIRNEPIWNEKIGKNINETHIEYVLVCTATLSLQSCILFTIFCCNMFVGMKIELFSSLTSPTVSV